MAGIFISYRREDSRADTGRLASDLKRYFAEEHIFRDIDDIEPGTDFVKAISSSVGACNALLAVVGPDWLAAKDKQGRRRLEDPNDYVRLEIEAALQRGIRVIPLLVGDAPMPSRGDLPDSIADFAQRQAHELSEKRWDFDVKCLVKTLDKIPGIDMRNAGAAALDIPTSSAQATKTKSIGRFAGAVVVSFFGVIFVLAGLSEDEGVALVIGVPLLVWAYWLFKK